MNKNLDIIDPINISLICYHHAVELVKVDLRNTTCCCVTEYLKAHRPAHLPVSVYVGLEDHLLQLLLREVHLQLAHHELQLRRGHVAVTILCNNNTALPFFI